MKSVTATGQKKSAKSKSICTKNENFEIFINKVPLNLSTDSLLISKFNDVILKVGRNFFENLKFEITVKGGGSVSQVYAARQAFCKSLVAFYGNYLDEWNKQEIKNRLLGFDKFTLVADPRRTEMKKFGGPGARARYQKSYR